MSDTGLLSTRSPVFHCPYGPGTDEPIVWCEGSGTPASAGAGFDRRWLHTDERGSVIAVTDGSGAVLGVNSYDPYGKPASGNIGRFGYTGQAWLPELGMWSYKARIYNPANTVARFMQSDPIGYGGGMNLYAYVGGDPVNAADPSGLDCATVDPLCSEEIVVTARRERAQNSIDGGGGGAGGGAGTGFGGV